MLWSIVRSHWVVGSGVALIVRFTLARCRSDSYGLSLVAPHTLDLALLRSYRVARPSRGASFAVLREVARSGLARLRLACCLDVKEPTCKV